MTDLSEQGTTTLVFWLVRVLEHFYAARVNHSLREGLFSADLSRAITEIIAAGVRMTELVEDVDGTTAYGRNLAHAVQDYMRRSSGASQAAETQYYGSEYYDSDVDGSGDSDSDDGGDLDAGLGQPPQPASEEVEAAAEAVIGIPHVEALVMPEVWRPDVADIATGRRVRPRTWPTIPRGTLVAADE
jgi:hypothetical protein